MHLKDRADIMHNGPVPPYEERNIGIGFYLTETSPLGGKLKKLPRRKKNKNHETHE